MLSLRGLFFIVLRAMFTSRLEIYNKTIIGFSFWFFSFELYNKTIIGFGFCDIQDYQCLGKNYHPCLRLG